MGLTRRELLRAAGAASLAAAGIQGAELQGEGEGEEPAIARRPLGRMGFEASILALGTAEIPAEDEAVRAIELALDRGVNYVDTAPSYQRGRSERAVGRVAERRRSEIFLATKTLERGAEGAFREVRESLGRLRTETIDLLQVHAVNDERTLARVLGKGGAVEGLEKARREGLVRHVGITGHTRPGVIAKAILEHPFESILVPVSAADRHVSDFAEEVIPLAVEKGISVAGMKSLKGIERHAGGDFDAAPWLRYALSLPLSTLTVGFRRLADVEADLAIAARFTPLTPPEMRGLEERARPWADADVLWWKKH